MKVGSLHIPTPFWGRAPAVSSDIFASPEQVDKTLFAEADRSIIRLVELLLERAHASRASDVHIDPRAGFVIVRERVDGALREVHTLPSTIHQELISRIKILSGLRIDEHYAAQDGRFRLTLDGTVVDVRVSVTPTYYGENAVLRILAATAEEVPLQGLGLSEEQRTGIERALARPYGMIVATGPTGSGKTTTMYTLLKLLNCADVSIATLEDPIEYSIPGVTQIQIRSKTELTFGNGLRSLLRQDPDIIMVGEIRDKETAGLAVNAALTGHRLLTTLHTNDAATTVVRLFDMGIEPYLVASVLSLVIAQRLVRKICVQCKGSRVLNAEERARLSEICREPVPPRALLYQGAGCERCNGTGFFGRAGVYEVMEVAPIRDAILRRAPAAEIAAIAQHSGMTTLFFDGVRKAFEGVTTIEEVLKFRYE